MNRIYFLEMVNQYKKWKIDIKNGILVLKKLKV